MLSKIILTRLRMAGKRQRQNNHGQEDESSRIVKPLVKPSTSGPNQERTADDLVGKINLVDGSVMLYRKENPRNGYRLKVPPLVWRETWKQNLEYVPNDVLDFVCKGRRSSGNVGHFQEDPDFLEADFSLVMNPEFEYNSGSMQFDVSTVGESGAILLATDQGQVEFAFSVRGKDVYRISDDFIATSEEKDHVQYIFDFAPNHIKNDVEPKFGGRWKYSAQIKRPLYTTEVAYCSI